MTRVQIVLARLALLALVLGAWEVLPRWGVLNPVMLPPLGDVLHALGGILLRPAFHEAALVSGAEFMVAYIIAVPLGLAIGVLIAENEYVGDIFRPILFYVFSVPKSIFLPMFIL